MNLSKKEIFISIAFFIGCILYLHYLMTISAVKVNSYSIYDIIEEYHMVKVISTPECGRFPQLIDLNVTDTYWQVTNTTNGTFYLFNAYFDDRDGLVNHTSVIRILAFINVVDPIVKTHCQLWYEGMSEAIPSEIIEYRMLWPKYWGVNTKGASPYLITCKNVHGDKGLVPQFVSLVENKCDKANNVMKVRNKRPKDGHKKLFLVSVKGVFFDNDVSMVLIEWCEILKILGVDKVEIFIVNAHANVKRILRFYECEDFVTVKFLKFPHDLPNKISESWHQWSQNDLVPYHDSFYENMYLYEYMVPMDIDEFIVPLRKEDRTWKDLLMRTIDRSKVKKETFDAFPVTNHYFLLKSIHENETIEGIPKGLRFLSNIYRAANFTPNGGNAKTFMRMDRILAVHNHFPFSCIGPESCRRYDVNTTDGQLSHYRTDCDNPECKESKSNPAKDITLWKYKEEILANVGKTIEKLRNFKSDFETVKLEMPKK